MDLSPPHVNHDSTTNNTLDSTQSPPRQTLTEDTALGSNTKIPQDTRLGLLPRLVSEDYAVAQRPTRLLNEGSAVETWVDFLRNPTPPDADASIPVVGYYETTSRSPHEISAEHLRASQEGNHEARNRLMTERKRRLTVPGISERRDRQGLSNIMAGNSNQQTPLLTDGREESDGLSMNTAIDLTSPAARHPRHSNTSTPLVSDRLQSDIVLPRWQPDAEAAHCPVCKTQFTFFYRKHHCRKCGRVVCAACSPHRITIPRQFIVHPPALPSAIIDLTGESEEATPPVSPSHLWGGEEVRVCNPCVPDPNLSPPPQQQQQSPGVVPPWSLLSPGQNSGSRLPPPRRHRNTIGSMHPPRVHPVHRSTSNDAALFASSQDAFRNRHLAFTNPSSVRDLWPPTAPPVPSGSFYPYPRAESSTNSVIGAPPPYRYRSLLDTSTPNTPSGTHQQPPSRRQISEEDICPVCFEELPVVTVNDDATAREAHITNCINASLGAGRTLVQNEVQEGDANASSSIPSASSSSLPAGNSMPSSSYASGTGVPSIGRRVTGGRMLVYQATEKDCLVEDGGPHECVICFEEFQQGDEMGRLECLCKFHRHCIISWWETKGRGNCPTHSLHD